MTVNTETELAFTVLDRASVENHHLFKDRDITSHRLRLLSTYFDTSNHVLGGAGWSLRHRQYGEKWFQTVKGPTVMATRPELEIPCDGQVLVIDHLRTTPIWRLINGNPQDLTPVFQTDIRRAAGDLHLPTATIETAIDDGNIYNMDRSRRLPISDLELEKKSGDITTLFRVAVELAIDTRIMIETASMAQRGYQLIEGVGPQFCKYGDIDLAHDTTAIDGLQHIIVAIVAHLRQNVKAAYVGQPGGIHQLRVAIRRMRAALLMFKPVLRADTVAAFDTELRYFGQVFGEARDWDVFITETLVMATRDLPHAKWLGLIENIAKKQQLRVHASIASVIENSRFNSLLIGLMGWAAHIPARSRVSERTIRKVVPALLTGVADKVATRERKLTADPDTVHALRKSLKKLRYAIEFVDSLYPCKIVRAFLTPCKDIQDVLGCANDLVVTHKLLSVLLGENAALAPAIEELSGWLSHRERMAIDALPKLLRRLRQDEPFWN